VSRTSSAAETKAEYVTVMGPELGPIFYALYNELSWLHIRWRQYLQLFGEKPSRVDLLNGAAGLFFRDVQDALWEDTLLHVSRITDRPETGGRQNLTIQRLPALLTDPAFAAEVQTLVDNAVSRSAFARDWRNRRIAHSDLALAIKEGAKPLAGGSRSTVVEALDTIGAVLNRLEQHFRQSTVFFEGFGHPGDGEALLYVIRDGLEAEDARRKRLQDGKLGPGDFDSRPV
jgi:hypothetical protein